MRHEDTMRMSDGVELHLTRFEAPSPRAVVCGLHGLGEYAGRYAAVGEAFNSRGLSLRMLDYRGHGLSPGKRGDAPYAKIIQDALEFLAASAQDGAPLILFGHSFGGGLAIHLLLTQPLPVIGGIVSSPWLRLVRPISGATAALLPALAFMAPGLTIDNGLDAAGLCSDPEKSNAYARDPLVHSKISLSMALGAHRAGIHSLAHAGELSVPLLLVHGGGDSICDPLGSRDFAAGAGALCEYREFPGMRHELHNESAWNEAFALEMAFVDKLLSGDGQGV